MHKIWTQFLNRLPLQVTRILLMEVLDAEAGQPLIERMEHSGPIGGWEIYLSASAM